MAQRSESRRSFFVQMMSVAAGAWVGVSTGGLAAWVAGCSPSTKYGGMTPPPPPPPGPEPGPTNVIAEPPPTNTIAEPPYQEQPPGPVVKYGGPPMPPDDGATPPGPAPMYGGPSYPYPSPTATSTSTSPARKYGGQPPGPTVKYGGPMPIDPGPTTKYGGPPGG